MQKNNLNFVTEKIKIILSKNDYYFFCCLFKKQMATKSSYFTTTNFECKICNYITSKKFNYNKHIFTAKHITATCATNLCSKSSVKTVINYDCERCGKKYIDRSGLWRHKKICSTEKDYMNSDIMFELIKQNQEFKELILEQNNKMLDLMKEKPYSIINNTNTNHFNMNFFLNEQCKDALNIKDFVSSIQLQLTDLENTGKLGYVNGISKIFVNGLKELDVYKRPVHCSDLKRETLYIKDENKWEKESNKLKTAIQQLSHKNIKQIPEWIKENPTCKDITSKKNDEYLNLVNNSMAGSNIEEADENYKKIIHIISKEVVIEKN
jgi:hypothetical protein